MNILLVYPQCPNTFWSFKHALKFISKKAVNIPLGIITVAALLPKNWKKKLVDMNIELLRDKDLIWADFVFISAMSIQLESSKQVIQRCMLHHTKVVAGGPLFTEEYERFPEIDHFVLNEAEITLPNFIKDIESGCANRIYRTDFFADLKDSPVPDYSLVKLNAYAGATIQYSRGCPYDCEFCDITALLGHRVRTKSKSQIISELDQLLQIGWHNSVFFVDDNIIGHKNRLMTELLPALIQWMELNNYPFIFTTEASINIADDMDLLNMMHKAGFTKVFVGIETPEENCLLECNKSQNYNRNLINSVNIIQQHGIEVTAGFIVGFDNDPTNIFQRQEDFIQKSGIITAMVGILNAPRFSKLYKRLQFEGRILDNYTGDNTNYSINFVPAMDKNELVNGYQRIIKGIYSSKSYYTRVKKYLNKYKPPFKTKKSLTLNEISALLKSIIYIGIIKKNRIYYWNLIFWCLWNKPRVFSLAITYSIYGYHFRKTFRNID